ncbi:MAG: flavin reductase family protein [Chloroflexota bacterium]
MSTKTVVPSALPANDAYRLLTSAVIPRPIAWVATMSKSGIANLAPYSFFNAVHGQPPMVIFSVGGGRNGIKDTLRNIQETEEFVVHILDEPLAEAMNETAGNWAFEVDEFEVAKLASVPSVDVKPPRVAEAPIAMEGKLTQLIPIAEGSGTLVLGEIIRFHIKESILTTEGLVDPNKIAFVSRLGGNDYGRNTEVFSMQRPDRK